MAIEKNMKTRIILNHGDWSAYENKKAKEGEVVLVKVGTTQASGNVTEPIWMMKVGDGSTMVQSLPWLVAPAADVYEWAKKENLDANDLPAIPGNKLGIAVTVTGDGNAITNASWDATTKTLTLTKGETFLKAGDFVDTTYSAGTKLDLDGTTFNHEVTTREDSTDAAETAEFGKAITVVSGVTSDETGHITGLKTKQITLPTPEEVSLPTVALEEHAGAFLTGVAQTNGKVEPKFGTVDVQYDTSSRKINLTINNTVVGTGFDASEFIKDGMIKTVELADADADNNTGKFLKITWNTPELEDEDTITYVDLTDLIDVYTAGEGIQVSGNVISHKVPDSVATDVTATAGKFIAGIKFDQFGHVAEVEATDLSIQGDSKDIIVTPPSTEYPNYKISHKSYTTQTCSIQPDQKPQFGGSFHLCVDTVENGHVSKMELRNVYLPSVVAEANSGLKVTTGQDASSNKSITIGFDEEVVFVLDGGTAADLTE